MRPCIRGPAPPLLARYGPAISEDYAARRAANGRHRFQWPHRDGQSLLEVVRDALRGMTDAHCAYCDGHPIDAVGEEQVDHFQPKTDRRFHDLVCAWTNLFLTCMRCNRAKRERWEPALLRPDAGDFTFERYFEYHFDTGELHPNGAVPAGDQVRARRTIEMLELNRAGACKMRREIVGMLRRGGDGHDADDLPYRFLAGIVTAPGSPT